MARAPSSSRRGDCSPIRIAADTAAATTMDDSGSLSLHSVEGFLENFEIAGVANLFARVLNPFLLQ